jgi:putative nucleotidyltransferase with HDIG domain
MTDLSAYAGRWVALTGQTVAGVGYTAEEALQLARRNRPKERFSLQFVEEAGGNPLALSPLLEQLRPFLTQQDRPVYLVGGAVRDALLNRVSHDLDFVVPHHAIQMAFKAANALNAPAYVLDQKRDTGRVVLPEAGTTLDFACYRGADLEADLRDRDFTINAMALPATAVTHPSLIDPCHGAADLQARLIRQTHDQAIANDPVRALRALRLAIVLNFSLTEETVTAVSAAAPLLHSISIERVRDELLKLLETAVPHQAIQQMADLGLLPVILPEIAALEDVAQSPPHHEPVMAHTLSVLRWLVKIEAILDGNEPGDAALKLVSATLADFRTPLLEHLARRVDGGVNGRTLLRLGALFHDTGKKETQTVEGDGRIRFLGHDKTGAKLAAHRLHHLTMSNQAAAHVEKIVNGHMRPLLLGNEGKTPSRRAIFRFFRDAQDAGLDICLLALTDHLATFDGPSESGQWEHLLQVVTTLLQHYFEHYNETIAPPALVTGRDLMLAFKLAPSPEIGRLLRLIQEAQAAGEVTTHDEALNFARQSRQ